MTMLADIIGIVALVPAMAGPIALPQQGGPEKGGPSQLVLALCKGGALAIPLKQGGTPAMPATVCCAKGCQRREKNRLVDPEQ